MLRGSGRYQQRRRWRSRRARLVSTLCNFGRRWGEPCGSRCAIPAPGRNRSSAANCRCLMSPNDVPTHQNCAVSFLCLERQHPPESRIADWLRLPEAHRAFHPARDPSHLHERVRPDVGPQAAHSLAIDAGLRTGSYRPRSGSAISTVANHFPNIHTFKARQISRGPLFDGTNHPNFAKEAIHEDGLVLPTSFPVPEHSRTWNENPQFPIARPMFDASDKSPLRAWSTFHTCLFPSDSSTSRSAPQLLSDRSRFVSFRDPPPLHRIPCDQVGSLRVSAQRQFSRQ